MKELNQVKTKLSTNIIREFRAPLTAIIEMADQIKGNEKAKALIHRNGSNLLELINQLLDLDKEDHNQLPLKVNNQEPAYLIGNYPVEYEPNKKPIILVIEDNVDAFIYIQHCLEKEYNLHLAQNGKIGIEMARELVPDIIISEVIMPEKNGFEITTSLKKNEKTSHIPIILLTTKMEHDDKLKSLKSGADACIIKPFDRQELLLRLSKIIETQNRLQNYYSHAFFKEPIPHPAGTQAELAFLEKLNGFIKDHLLDADFSMASLSKYLKMSQIQVYRKIKSLTHQTPTQYIRAKRLSKAVELLQNTQLNISEIAYQVGYTDPNYFSRTFHKEYGRTPSSYR